MNSYFFFVAKLCKLCYDNICFSKYVKLAITVVEQIQM